MEIEECSPSGGVLKSGSVGKNCGTQYRSDNPDREAPVEVGELPFWDVELEWGGFKLGIQSISIQSRQQGIKSAYPCGGAPKEEELTAERYGRE